MISLTFLKELVDDYNVKCDYLLELLYEDFTYMEFNYFLGKWECDNSDKLSKRYGNKVKNITIINFFYKKFYHTLTLKNFKYTSYPFRFSISLINDTGYHSVTDGICIYPVNDFSEYSFTLLAPWYAKGNMEIWSRGVSDKYFNMRYLDNKLHEEKDSEIDKFIKKQDKS